MTDQPETYLAHVREEGDTWVCHELEEHLHAVADRAAASSRHVGGEQWARLAGLWHDLGKYAPEFQSYIRTASGFDPGAHLEGQPGRVDHSTAGAVLALDRFGVRGRVLAYLIAGHHTGLADWQSDRPAGPAPLANRLTERRDLLDRARAATIPDAILDAPLPTTAPPPGADLALWIRMLFSCVVDADFLDTEAFMDPNRGALRGGHAPPTDLLCAFDAHMMSVLAGAPDTPVNRVRADVLARCREAATAPPGLFSLTVPTGGGKTLASMAFALGHAVAHGKRRVVYVIPYTSIIEQTADVFRGIFDEAVLEHHSNLDADRETPRSRLAAENWDAPVVVTTSVQFFESLFAARTSRVRKLHNIADSVVVLDEAQLLPAAFLAPIRHALAELARHYGVTVLFCTATQPVLTRLEELDFRLPGFDDVREIAADPHALHDSLRRVTVNVPGDLNAPVSWEALAPDLAEHLSVLCIVDRRDDARALWRLMPEGTVHLSALMCGQHRSEVIADIKARLERGEPVRAVSTQLVEAGVDLDFPVVYRALAGLDSVAQAGGRCNREGRLPRLGRVVVFVPPRPAPPGPMRWAQDTGRSMLRAEHPDPLSPARFPKFFRQLYWKHGERLDSRNILGLLRPNTDLAFSFRTAAEAFHLIDDGYLPVVVRYGRGAGLIERLRHEEPSRTLLRRLQRYVVSLPPRIHASLLESGAIAEVHPGVFVQVADGLYHPQLGLVGDHSAGLDPQALIA